MKQFSFRTGGDVVVSKDELLCYAAPHADVHLGQQLSSGLTPSVILRQQGHLNHGGPELLALAQKWNKCRRLETTKEKVSHVQELDLEA